MNLPVDAMLNSRKKDLTVFISFECYYSFVFTCVCLCVCQFVPQGPPPVSEASPASHRNTTLRSSRIQDRELQEMSDEGMCMSMHQPWASLLVAGIKMYVLPLLLMFKT